jgi:hypothetical protein
VSNFFLDTEFVDDGRTIDLISIALVHESNASYYAVSSEFDPAAAGDWVRQNVLPQVASTPKMPRRQIAEDLVAFVTKQSPGKPAIIHGWYASYDWVALCQLYGPMINLPNIYPKYIRDLKTHVGAKNETQLPKKTQERHNALRDAQWIHEVYRHIATGWKV